MNEKIEKIVELDIDDDMLEEEFEGTGVEIVSIVDRPAIKEDFLYFNTDEFITPNPCQSGYVAYGTKIKDGREVPNCIKVDNTELVEPNAGEGHDEYMSRCIAYEIDEGKEQEQAIAICHSKWEAVHGPTEMSEEYEFESYNDYPKGASDAACKVLRWIDEHGRDEVKGMTQTGLRRANQLCNREPISRDTISRMASFARHRQNAEISEEYKGTPWKDKGYVAWLGWGNSVGIDWAQRKLEQIDREKEEMSKHSCKKDKNGKCKYATEEEQRAILDFAEDDNNGIYLGVDDIYLDFTKTSFGIGDVLKSISGLDILKRLAIKKDEPAETYWRYSGPSPQRDFCKAMMRLSNRGKIFTTEEINKMNNVSNLNPGMGKGGSDFYSVLQYAGGVSCRHYLQKLKVFKGDNGKKVIIATNETDNEEEVNAMKSQNSNQPGPLGSIANNARVNMSFNLDDEKRIVTGPLMIPNKFILRMSEDGSPFYIYFSRKTIRKMAEKFFRMNNHNNTDINHDDNVTNDNTLIESWISESIEHDKSYKYGFRLPRGTWYVSYKINDDDTWEKIKSGELKGFSLAGGFIQKMKRVDPEKKLNEIKDILKNVTDD